MLRSLRSTVILTILGLGTLARAQATAPAHPPTPSTKEAASFAWRDATTAPLPGWTGPVFKLSHDYPQKDPGTCPSTLCKWLVNTKNKFDKTPVKKDKQRGGSENAEKWTPEWAEYMQRILDYVREGQDAQLDNEVGWRVQVNGNTRWFHVPWMAYDPTRGREFIHGLTNERTAKLEDFLGKNLHISEGINLLPLTAKSNTPKGYETWAFGVYNEWGGYAIGRSWGPDGKPRTAAYNGVPQPAGLPFPEGTLVAKLLFTSATPKDVPYLAGAPTWQAYRHVEKDNQFQCERAVQEVRLVQLDIAVVDKNSPTRWVFGTFAYNGKLKGKTVWERLEPVGLQWGNDPWSFPGVPEADSTPIIQSVLNTKIGTPQHFGCNKRLAGPVDNKLSSCIACHANGYTPREGLTAAANTIPPIFGFPGQCDINTQDNSNYFTNNQFPMSYSGGQYENLMNMDTSLQMQVAFLQYGQFAEASRPAACEPPIGN